MKKPNILDHILLTIQITTFKNFINTNFDEEGKYNLGWLGGSFLDWWRDLYRMRSAPGSNKTDDYLYTDIRQALLQKIPHFGHSNYKDFAKYRKSNPTFKTITGDESGLPDNDFIKIIRAWRFIHFI